MKSVFIISTLLFLTSSVKLFSQVQPPQTQESQTPTTKVEFEESEYDFGRIESGEKVVHIFKFTNTGDVPMVITSARGSCGCTVPFYPKVPILSGESSEIEVEFDSRGKMGLQHKKVYLIANTVPSMIELIIKGEVMRVEDSPSIETKDGAKALKRENDEKLTNKDPSCFIIYPNPSSDLVQIELKEHIGENAMIYIHNETGIQVLEQKVERISRESTQVDVSEFTPGMYMITIVIDNIKLKTQCFMVTR